MLLKEERYGSFDNIFVVKDDFMKEVLHLIDNTLEITRHVTFYSHQEHILPWEARHHLVLISSHLAHIPRCKELLPQ